MKLVGKVWKYGENVDTDAIIPARYLNMSLPEELAEHCMEDIDRGFASQVKKGDIIVGGDNFGCGSSREHAPLAIKGAGVSCVIANSFARIFYRNAINIGLPILECAEAVAETEKGDELTVDLTVGTITNARTGKTYRTSPLPEFVMQIVAAGGLVPYTRERLQAKPYTWCVIG
ncbi:MAG: 3-isopropylmalate dehydratase small subunit [Anaerolineae bacterium]|nr:3-isopropylmalate dehydratase small subunit [Anaerolineae bacterium]